MTGEQLEQYSISDDYVVFHRHFGAVHINQDLEQGNMFWLRTYPLGNGLSKLFSRAEIESVEFYIYQKIGI